ncbi:phosphatidylinositol transfer protein Pdr17p [Monosporozyma unispora]|nr:lipid biosynthesis and multidrug resistance [Kazachstania unispora]
MGFFSRKKDDGLSSNNNSSSSVNLVRKDLIPCEKMPRAPPDTYPKPEGVDPITPEQFEDYKVILAHFQNPDLKLALNTNDLDNGTNIKTYIPLLSWEKFWLTRECFLRYLRANKWNTEHTIKHLTNTLCWRRETGLTHDPDQPDPLSADKVSVENETGKETVLGFDKMRRPLFYMKNGRQNTEPSFRQVQHMIYMMESAVSMCPQGVEKVTVLVDFKLYKEPGIISDKAPPISIARACLNVLQNHYPERLAKCILINAPWYISAFLKMMYPFLDPATKEKAIFDEPFENHIEPEQLEALYNGRLDFTYKHDVYWPDMVEVTHNTRKQQYLRWVSFGGKIGLSEFDLKGDHEELKYPVDHDMTKK